MRALFFSITFLMVGSFSSCGYAHTFFKNSRLIDGVYRGKLSKVKRMIDKGANVEFNNEHGDSPLIIAASLGTSEHEKIAFLLMEKGAQVGARGQYNTTPLMRAIQGENARIVEGILNASGDPKIDAIDAYAKSALHYSLYGGHKNFASWIVDKGALSSKVDFRGMTPMAIAIKKDFSEVVSLMIEKGYPVNFQSPVSQKFNILDGQGNKVNSHFVETTAQTALMQSVLYPCQNSITEAFINNGADLDLQDSDGNSALIYASYRCSKSKVQLLVEAGADPSIQNFNNKTPLSIAIQKGCTDVQLYLKEVVGGRKARKVIAGATGVSKFIKKIKRAKEGSKGALSAVAEAGAGAGHDTPSENQVGGQESQGTRSTGSASDSHSEQGGSSCHEKSSSSESSPPVEEPKQSRKGPSVFDQMDDD